ncbi:MAG: hypothetical protein Q8P68_01510 [Candidatus Peregrinibacteria bacterium]|nr:hypothetical protein [Candidatus Peregrinibacteria bacterium]
MTSQINPKLKQLYEKNDKFFLILSIILLIVTGYFSFGYYSELSDVKASVLGFEQVEETLTKKLSDASVDFASKTELFTDRRNEHLFELQKVFPLDAEKTNFTRFVDDYFFRNNFLSNEIFLKSMVYGNPSPNDGYYVIPVSMSITSSKTNFMNFLRYVENSGAIQSNIRVMDIKSIDVTFREDDRNNRLYDYRVSLNIYYQNQNAPEEGN